MCTCQLTSVLFIYLKLEVYFFGKEFVTIFIALSFLSKLSLNSFFMHESRTIKSQQLQTGLMRYMILELHGNETRSSCDQRLFFSLGASRLVDAGSPRTISIANLLGMMACGSDWKKGNVCWR